MFRIDSIKESLRELEDERISTATLLDNDKKDIASLSKKYDTLEKDIKTYEASNNVLNEVSKLSRQTAIDIIESTVTPMVKSVLGTQYSFKVIPSILRGKPAVDLKIVEFVDGEESEQDLLSGGFLDAISTGFRYAFLSLYEGGINNAVILDEPARMVSENASKDYADFIKYLGATFNRQTIMCTHKSEIAQFADRIINIEKTVDGSTINYES